MILGTVNSHREARVPLILLDRNQQTQEIEAVVDTGFNGFLTLPPDSIEELGLKRLGRGRAILADGSESIFEIFAAAVLWDGQRRDVEADAAETDALIGMALLDRYSLHVEVISGGSVTIDSIG
jgi:clan AA aspartic protease